MAAEKASCVLVKLDNLSAAARVAVPDLDGIVTQKLRSGLHNVVALAGSLAAVAKLTARDQGRQLK